MAYAILRSAKLRWRRNISLLFSLIIFLVAGFAGASTSQAEAGRDPVVNDLPKPFADWNVTVKPVADDPNVLHLEFDSPRLKRRVMNTVYLPRSYRFEGPAMSVMYAIHGTVTPQTDNCAIDAVTGVEVFIDMISCGGGYVQNELYSIDSQLDKMEFIVVSPDTDPKGSFCHTCVWIDGREDIVPNLEPVTATPILADSYLHKELMPLVEVLFNTRTDRAGRGVFGFSMGGWAAFLQGFIHPDRYAYVGSVSGAYDLDEPELRHVLQAIGYLRDQGYGEPVINDVWWRQFSPDDVATNISGVDTELFLSNGTTCLELRDLTAEDCQGKWSPVVAPGALWAENILLKQYKIAVRDIAEKGIPAKSVLLPGTHGSNNHRIFSDYIVPAGNKLFNRQVEEIPETFSYRSALPAFSVWQYDVTMTRQNDEFLAMTAARTDGRSLQLHGSGVARVTTPARFKPGKTYSVTTIANDEATKTSVTADSKGRLPLALDLGRGFILDENQVVNDTGLTAPNTMQVTIEG